ncbi:hypothetical protein DXG01_003558, partial [Tephrocybe rancida]
PGGPQPSILRDLPHMDELTRSVNKQNLWSDWLAVKKSREAKTAAQIQQNSDNASSSVQADNVENITADHSSNSVMGHFANNQLSEPLQPPSKRSRRATARLLTGDYVLNDPELQDILPVPLLAVDPEDDSIVVTPPVDSVEPPSPHNIVDTIPNAFGVFRRYTRSRPSGFSELHDPDSQVNLATLSDIRAPPAGEDPPDRDYAPFPNKSAFLLSDWFWNHGGQKSKQNFQRLLKIIGSPEFKPADIATTNWRRLDRQLAINDWNKEEWQNEDAGWMESNIHISVPFHRNTDNPGNRDYTSNGFYHRSLVSIIKAKLTLKKDDARFFHLEPYELLWHPNEDQQPQTLYGEMYSSPAFLKAHRELQDSPAEPGCSLPRVVVALMFWSDATHLTQFGSAKITPLYMYFGNESKYRRCKPSCKLGEHAAFFQQLPDSFKDFATRWTGGKKVSAEFTAFCNREFAHEQWRMLLDDEFLLAYEHGLVLDWIGDGQRRRFYPRILTYSADYPEKCELLNPSYAIADGFLPCRVLMATIRQLGGCPCPRCKIPKKNIHMMGSDSDRAARINLERRDDGDWRKKVTKARQSIYGKTNFAVDSAAVERELKPESLVPTLNAFSDRLQKFGLPWPSMFVVDLLHEIELGVCKALIIHLLRILDSVDENLMHELDRRFRAVPTFGRDTIRRFTSNASELKKMAAHNYEDLIQCMIPVFDGLLSDDAPNFLNRAILRILFHLAHWHGLAKLRLHSSSTLDLLDQQTTALGDCLREFQIKICPAFSTRELRREAVARERRAAVKKAASSYIAPPRASGAAPEVPTTGTQEAGTDGGPGSVPAMQPGLPTPQVPEPPVPGAASHATVMPAGGTAEKRQTARKERKFSLSTYKFHAMGDYVSAIRTFGTTDSYSTEIGELEHRVPKSNYRRTSKKSYPRQLAQMDKRQSRLRLLEERMNQSNHGARASDDQDAISASASASPADPAMRYHIGVSEHIKKDIRIFMQENSSDPSITHFYNDLQKHLLPRLKASLKIPHNSSIPVDRRDPDRERVFYQSDALYEHNILRLNYTTYDVRRRQDVINPKTDHRDIMLLRWPTAANRDPTKHQYRYARVLRIFHVKAIYHGPMRQERVAHRLDFLWVRWFEMGDGHDLPVSARWSEEHLGLDQLKFAPIFDNPDAFGFIDPSDIIRGCHIVPRFCSSQPHSDGKGASGLANDGRDWCTYYVNRDMLMRYHWGLGIGHVFTRGYSNSVELDAPASRTRRSEILETPLRQAATSEASDSTERLGGPLDQQEMDSEDETDLDYSDSDGGQSSSEGFNSEEDDNFDEMYDESDLDDGNL